MDYQNQKTIGPVSLTCAEDMLKSAVIKEKKFKHSLGQVQTTH